jgi:hypothetical protein
VTKDASPPPAQLAPFRAICKRIAKKLEGFTPDFPADLDRWDMGSHQPDARDFPVPGLVLFTMRNLMGWPWSSHGEKVRWSVYGRVAGEPVVFEHRKFGFAILRGSDAKIPNSRIEGQLKTALKEVGKFLEPFAEHQVGRGEVVIVNRFGEFDARYRFFRNLADKAYKRATKPLRPSRANRSVGRHFDHLTGGLNQMMAANREGFFHSTVMVDSYFSALEHRLVLLRAFTGQPLNPGELLEILVSKWDNKLKLVLSVTGDQHAEEILGRMRRIRERIRNPFAHGEFENDGGSLFFHLPHVGTIPANFARFGDSVRFSFVPIEADDHGENCAVFDGLDKLLSSGPLAGSHKLMDAGVDPSFDTNTLKSYADALAGGDSHLEAFIEHWGREWDAARQHGLLRSYSFTN